MLSSADQGIDDVSLWDEALATVFGSEVSAPLGSSGVNDYQTRVTERPIICKTVGAP